MKRRTLAKTAATLAAAFFGGKAAAQTEAKKPCACTFRQSGNNITLYVDGAKKSGCELAILGGDIINFPSECNVKKLAECMANSEIPCRYIAGNHDWHFEGSGPDIPQPNSAAGGLKSSRRSTREKIPTDTRCRRAA